MKNLRAELAKIIDSLSPEDGFHETPVEGVHCIKFSQTDRPTKRYWRASLGIVAQGSKEITLSRDVYRYDAAHYIATPIALPVTSRIFAATPDKPFLCLLIDFDSLVVSEIAARMESDYQNENNQTSRAVFVGKASEKFLDTAVRLGKLFQTPEDAEILAPLLIKEIFYHLLKGNDGAAIRQFALSGSKTHKITQAIYQIKSSLSDELNIETLAKTASMSRSAFFKHFKEVTAMSPIQYKKRLQLLEAKRLMTEADETAESSAFQVGYKSASQFSREYSRMFGNPPLRDILEIKETDQNSAMRKSA